ncbi:MAG: hypothetical protein P1P87_03675 [Trueperaceae bacterium]|nr:hypothetical protein [Trueperaceae bacterium]
MKRAAAGVLRWLQDSWWAASAPVGFFAHLAERDGPRPLPAVATAFGSWAAAAAVAALAFVRATGSDGYLLLAGFAAAVLVPLAALVTILGGLMLLGPGGLGSRAWEIVGWAWAPAGVLALALLPVVPLFPGAASAAAVVAFPAWHLGLVGAALAAFDARARVRTVLLYALAVFLIPGTIAALALLAAGAA